MVSGKFYRIVDCYKVRHYPKIGPVLICITFKAWLKTSTMYYEEVQVCRKFSKNSYQLQSNLS